MVRERPFLQGGDSSTTLRDQLGDQRGPAGLMACAEAGAFVPVEIFVERDVIAPMLVFGEQVVVAEDRAAARLGVAQEDAEES